MRVLSVCRKFAPACLSAAALFIAGDVLAQAPAPAPTQPERQFTAQFRPFHLIGSGCPVAMTATQRGLSQQVETGKAAQAGPAQGLTITLSGRIVSAEVVAHALSGKNRALLTSTAPEPDVTRTFQLASQNDRGFSADLRMDGVTSIRWIEVKSMTFSDGNVWHESEIQRCRIEPDPFVLISSAR